MTTTLAPAFHVSHRTIAGQVSDPITAVKDDTWVTVTATITTAHTRGTGSNTRVLLGLTADNGSIAVATIAPFRVQQTPDFLRMPGIRVQVRGLVRHTPGIPTVLEVTGITPGPECPDCGAPLASQKWIADEHHPKCPRRDPNF